MKKILISLLVLAGMAAAGLFYVHQQMQQTMMTPLIEEDQLFTVERGMHGLSIVREFSPENELWFKLQSRLEPQLSQIQQGTFQLKAGMDLNQVLTTLREGKEFQYRITLIEGSTWKEILAQVQQADGLVMTLDENAEAYLMEKWQVEAKSLEGMLLAETYKYTTGTSDEALLRRAYLDLQKVLEEAWPERQEGLPYETAYEALIMASIIEKETGVADERPLVSSVFVNRLRKGMRLQTDPTVIYGMGDRYDGRIRKKDLRESTPYNTYVIWGLPPTPIAMPGKEAIDAALNPVDSEYFYFVASEGGRHKFSKTLAEHNAAVRKYILDK